MPADTLKIFCTDTGSYVDVKGGETLAEIFARLDPKPRFTPICARVNNKTEWLGFPVFHPKQVTFLSSTTPSGERVYVRSLCMLLYKALHDCFPGTRLRIEHSVSRGYYCRLFKGAEATPEAIERLRRRMAELVEMDLPFERHERLTSDVIKIFASQGLNDKVRLLRTVHSLYTTYYSLDGLCDSYYGCLAPSTGHLRAFDLRPYKDGFLLLGHDPENPLAARTPTVQEKMYEAFTDYLKFNHVIGVRNAGEQNLAVEEGRSTTLINVAEALHVKHIGIIADCITERFRRGGAKVVLIAGPSSSGKTTFTKRLAVQLLCNLLEPKMISLDDYFINRVDTPRDEDGDYDFESLYALDLKQFNTDLNRLIAGEEVQLPTYNFEHGEREYKGKRIHLDDNSILLIEGIHGLNPELTSMVEERMKYRVYVSALTTLAIDDHSWVSTTDNRLLRRIIRDHKYRGVSATETLRRWPSVRRGEERWIFPYQENADSMFNSSLIFELAVMKDYADALLKNVARDIPEYAQASRLRSFLSYFTSISPDAIPPTSLLREFLGGSSFHY